MNLGGTEGVATSTPTGLAPKHFSTLLPPPLPAAPAILPPSPLMLHHDDKTRQQLEALVQEIDQYKSPPPLSTRSPNDKQDVDAKEMDDADWLRHLRTFSLRFPENVSPFAEDQDGRLINTRSSKRVRLCVSENRAPYEPRSGRTSRFRDRMFRSTYTPGSMRRTILGRHQSPRSKATALSQTSTVPPPRPPLRSLPPMSVPVGKMYLQHHSPFRSSRYPTSLQDGSDAKQPPTETDSPADLVQDRIDEAKALMERIKARSTSRKDHQANVFTTRTPQGDLQRDTASFARPHNPTPMTAAVRHALTRVPSSRLPSYSDIERAAHSSTRQVEARDPASVPLQVPSRQPMSLSAAPLQRREPMLGHCLASYSSYGASDHFSRSSGSRAPSSSTAATSVISSLHGEPDSNAPEKGFTAEATRLPQYVGHPASVPDDQPPSHPRSVLHDNRPDLSIIPEGNSPEDGTNEYDPFQEATATTTVSAPALQQSSRHTRKASWQSSQRHASQTLTNDKTSTPPYGAVDVPPIVSPQLPDIHPTETRSGHDGAQAAHEIAAPQPPRSVLKIRPGNAFSTPLPTSRSISAVDQSKLGRSVSFSDGRMSGKIIQSNNERARQPVPRSRLGLEYDAGVDDDGHASEEDEMREESDSRPAQRTSQGSNAEHTQGEDAAASDHHREEPNAALGRYGALRRPCKDNLLPEVFLRQTDPHESSSNQSTPTAVFALNGRSRSLRTIGGGGFGTGLQNVSMATNATTSNTNTTLAWHRKPLNANATILTECSFGVSHDKLLQILTDVAPFEPCWKDLTKIDLSQRQLDSVVRVKEFLPKLDRASL